MALGSASAARFHGSGRATDLLAIFSETIGRTAVGDAGSIFAAGILRTSAFLLCRTYADGQCVDAQRMEAVRAVDGYIHSDAADGKGIFKERSQAGTSTEDSD